MSIIELLYNQSPVTIQNIFCSLKGYLISKRRYNKNFFIQLKKFENKEYDKQFLLKEFFEKINHITYYKKLFSDYYFDKDSNDIYTEIKKLPILTKNKVKEDIKLFINPNYSGKVLKAKTSGTTGSGLVFPYSQEMENKQWAIWWRYRRWHGIDLKMWCGWFGGRTIIPISCQNPPYWRINNPCKQIMFSAYHLNNDTVIYYYNEILKRELRWLHGYPSQLSLLAFAIKEKCLSPLLCVSFITFGSENLLKNQKEVIHNIFPNAILRQHYGLSEGVANISEDTNGNFVVDDDFCYVEFIPLSREKPNLCRIIGTGFSNLAFPLVRYDTGDIAEIEYTLDGKFNIISLDGRKEDFITLPSGVKLGRLDHIFKSLIAIKEAQIYQKDLYHIDFNIVRGISFNIQDENDLMKEIRKRIDESVSIKINYVEKISKTSSGKLRLVVSDI